MKSILIILILFIQTSFLFGQGKVTGVVIDKTTQTPIEYANVEIYKQSDHKFIVGAITDVSGKFSIDNIAFGEYELKYSFIGFEKMETRLFTVNKNSLAANLGTMELAETALNLNEVVVTARKSTYVTQIDKKYSMQVVI